MDDFFGYIDNYCYFVGVLLCVIVIFFVFVSVWMCGVCLYGSGLGWGVFVRLIFLFDYLSFFDVFCDVVIVVFFFWFSVRLVCWLLGLRYSCCRNVFKIVCFL